MHKIFEDIFAAHFWRPSDGGQEMTTRVTCLSCNGPVEDKCEAFCEECLKHGKEFDFWKATQGPIDPICECEDEHGKELGIGS